MKVGFVLDTHPKVSETFITNEILEMQRLGVGGIIYILHSIRREVIQPNEHLIGIKRFILPKGFRKKKDLLLHSNFSLFSRSPGRYVKSLIFILRYFSRVNFRYYLMASVLANHALSKKNTVLYAHFSDTPGLIAFLASKFSGIPFGFTIHGVDIFVNDSLFYEIAEEASFIIIKADYVKKYIKRKFPDIDSKKFFVVHCGIDLDFFKPLQRKISNKKFTLISIGRLVEKKGFERLIKTCAILKTLEFDFECKIVGVGVEGKLLKLLVKRKGLEDKVEFIGSVTHGSNFLNNLKKADLFIQLYRIAKNGDRDTIPNSMLEAMAAGVPVLVSSVGGVREAVVDYKNGFLVNSSANSEEIAKKVMEISKMNSGQIRAISEKARKIIVKDFNIKSTAKQTLLILRKFHVAKR